MEQDDSCCGKIKEAGMDENETNMDEDWVRGKRSCKEWQKLMVKKDQINSEAVRRKAQGPREK